MVIEGKKIKIFATIPFPNKIEEREISKKDLPGTFNAGATLGPINQTKMERIWTKHKNTDTTLKPKVFVGMSGGVDSSVGAALLKKQGYEVVGVFIKTWEPPNFKCTWREDRRDAMRVAALLDIPLVTLDLEKEYKRNVVDYLIAEYQRGRTPNPDVMCNKAIKFGAFYDWARARGADYVATGHYAQIAATKATLTLQRAKDENKDQTYFLWNLGAEQLAHILFPVGHLTKPAVRALAKKFKLPTAEKKDSQGLCFIGQIDFKNFLKSRLKLKPGQVINEDGQTIGQHEGALLYTIGERHGFEVKQQSSSERPRFVVARDLAQNTLTVSPTPAWQQSRAARVTYDLGQCHWINEPPKLGRKYHARIRHRGELYPCQFQKMGETAQLEFLRSPLAPAAGQSAVIYQGDICLGGGVMG